MNAGTVAGGGITRVGDRGYFMNCSHVGHDCMVGNDVDLRDLGDAGRPLRDRRFCFHGRAVGGAPIHPGRAAGDGRRRLRRARRRDSVRPRQRPVCQPRRPQHHRHEAPQIHPRAARDGTVVLSKAVSRPRHVCRAAERGAGIWRLRIPRSRKSWLSSTPASIASCACRRQTAATGLDDGMSPGRDHDDDRALEISSPVGLIAAGGVMPFAVADSLIARGIDAGAVRAERRLRSGGRGTLSPPLDFGRPDRPRHETVSQRELPRPGFHRHAGAAGAVGDPAGLGTLRVVGRCWPPSAAATIICCPGSAASSRQDGFRMVGIRDVAPDC